MLSQPETVFVQSAQYGDFFEAMGEVSWSIGVFDGDRLVGGALVVSTHAKRGDFLYIPYGPVISHEDKERAFQIYHALFRWLASFARKEKYDFIRVSPFVDDGVQTRQDFARLGFRKAPMHMLAEHTWILDVRNSEEQLLAAMNKNHRNLIRRCERDGVTIRMTSDPKQLDGLDRMLSITAERHNFVRFSRSYIEKEFTAFAKSGQAVLFEAYLPDGTLDGAAIIMFYGKMAAYRHSASLSQNKQLPTSYALQWAVIQEAKRRGVVWYNFWGVAPEGASPKHPFYGITHFKKGFGGFQKNLLPCHDLPVSSTYALNWLVETIRRYKRGFN